MIAIIGIMLGAYIITRMIDILIRASRDFSTGETILIAIFAVLTIIVCVIGMAGLIFRQLNIPDLH